MNHIYRSIWNASTATFVATPEIAHSAGKKATTSVNTSAASNSTDTGSNINTSQFKPITSHKIHNCHTKRSSRTLKTLALALSTLFASALHALPTGGTVAAGAATLSATANNLTVKQDSQNAVLNWTSFNIGAQESVTFAQPGPSAVALNRVLGSDASSILGSLSATGKVFLVNPNGIVFGRGASVNVSGLVASSRDISDEDFKNGSYKFSGSGSGAVLNQGTLTATGAGAAGGGYVVLLGASVSNEGTISANAGTAALVAAKGMTMDIAGDGLLNITVDPGAVNAVVNNSGLVQADGGQILLSAQAATGLLSSVVNNTGVLQAQTLSNQKGSIKLLAGMDSGKVSVGGTLDASAPSGGDGGFIETSAANVSVADSAKVTTLAANGNTGEWLIDPSDYTIGTGGNITGVNLSINLNTNNITIKNFYGTTGSIGNININDAVNWSVYKLSLTAFNDINVNAVMTATGSATLALNPDDSGGIPTSAGRTGSQVGNLNMALGASGFTGKIDFANTALGALTIKGVPQTVIQNFTDLQNNLNTLNLAGHLVLGATFIGSNYTPVGSSATPFSGSLDGLGHTVGNLTINTAGIGVGLIGYSSSSSEIRNIGIINSSASGLSEVGLLVGNSQGKISNSFATGSVSASASSAASVGGLVGRTSNTTTSRGIINNSYANVVVSSTTTGNYTGGLVGFNTFTDISNSYALGQVFGRGVTGGLLGSNTSSTISYSFAAGTVDGQSNTGGLVGSNTISPIKNSYAVGTVTGNSNTGGLVGSNSGTSPITDSYATGAVNFSTGNNGIGGLVGNNSSSNIYGSHATGNVSYLGASNLSVANIGGLAGINTNSIISNSYAEGNVTADGGFSGANIGGLVGESLNTSEINTSHASGTIRGKVSVGGLVGLNNKTITTSYATGATFGNSQVGGLVGSNTATTSSITKSYATGNVTGSGTANAVVGGLVGINSSSGAIISDSYATGSVSGAGNTTTTVGGLVGTNSLNATISKSYAIGTVTGTASTTLYLGGLVGNNSGTINNSYRNKDINPYINDIAINTGNVGSIPGLSTEDMKDKTKLVNFDFTSATPVWGFNASLNNGYPILCAINSCSTAVITTVYINPLTGFNVYGTAPVFSYSLLDSNGAVFSLSNASVTGSISSTSAGLTQSTAAGNYSFTYVGGLSLSGSGASNYSLTPWTTPTSWQVKKASLTVTADNKSRLYGENNPEFTTTLSGFVNGETASTAGLTGAASATTAAISTSNAGTPVAITPNAGTLAANNYDFSNLVNGTLTINKALLAVRADDKTRAYGAQNPELSTTLSGFLNNETSLTAEGFSGNADVAIDGTPPINTTAAGTIFSIRPSIGTLTATNYDFTNLSIGTLTITKAPLTVTAKDKARNYGNPNPSLTTTLSGFANNENSYSAHVTGQAGVTIVGTQPDNNTSAGSTFTIIPSAGTLTATNYDFSNLVNGTLTINKAHLTVTADDKTRLYGAANPTFTTTLSGFVNGETALTAGLTGAASATTAAISTSNAGTPVAIIPDANTLVANNYDFSNLVNGALTITQAPLTYKATPVSRTYGTAIPTKFSGTVVGLKNNETLSNVTTGTEIFSRVTGDTNNAGDHPIYGSGLSLLPNSNYSLTPNFDQNIANTKALTITKAPLNIKANNASRSYGGANPTFSYALSGFVNGETASSANVSGKVAFFSPAVTASDIGSYPVTPSLSTSDPLTATNYDFTTFTNGTLSVLRAPLTVKANNASRSYGGANPTFGYTFSGFVNGDAASVVSGSPTLSTLATATTLAGTNNVISIADNTDSTKKLSAANYYFPSSFFVNGNLAIAKAPLTVTANNASRSFGAANPSFGYTFGGLMNGDSASVVSNTPSLTTTATVSSAIGAYTINIANNNLMATNYFFPTWGFVNGTLSVLAAPTAGSLSGTTGGSTTPTGP